MSDWNYPQGIVAGMRGGKDSPVKVENLMARRECRIMNGDQRTADNVPGWCGTVQVIKSPSWKAGQL